MVVIRYVRDCDDWERFLKLLPAIIGDKSVFISPRLSPEGVSLQLDEKPSPESLHQIAFDSISDYEQVAVARLTGKVSVKSAEFAALLELRTYFDAVKSSSGTWRPIHPVPLSDAARPGVVNSGKQKPVTRGLPLSVEGGGKTDDDVAGPESPVSQQSNRGAYRIWESGNYPLLVDSLDFTHRRLLTKIDDHPFPVELEGFQLKTALRTEAYLHFGKTSKGKDKPTMEPGEWLEIVDMIFSSITVQEKLNF